MCWTHPPRCYPHLCGGNLLAGCKKGSGHRPIAVREVLRRLVSNCLSRCILTDALQVLTPLQVGVGVRGGCEAVVHSVSHILEDMNLPSTSKCTLLLDYSNTFNSISRAIMFEEVRARIPTLAAWAECCYSSQPLLHLGEHTIFSRCGVQQGDPLGPLLFSLTLHPIVERIKREVPHLNINVWYLDNGTLCGNPNNLMRALEIVEEDSPARGLYLNRGKSLLYVPADLDALDNPLQLEIPICRTGFCLLGAPIGLPEFRESKVLNRVEKIRAACDNLHHLEDSQFEATLLCSCLAMPKFNFALRTCPPSTIQHAIIAFDNLMRETLADLVGRPLSDWAWQKASLPLSFGGLNLCSANLHAPTAFISSLA